MWGANSKLEDTPNNKIPWKVHCDRLLAKFYPSVIVDKDRFVKWFMSKEKIGWFFDEYLIVRIYCLWREKIMKENDVVIILCGREGNGKSTLAMQIAAWFDDGFNNDHICLTREHLEDEWIKNYPSKAVLTDEGGFMLFSRNAMMPENKEIIQAFMLLRQYRLVNIICCPQYTSIDLTMRNQRVHLLINVTARGEYQAYFGRDLDKVNSDLNKRRIKLEFIRVSMMHSWTGKFNRFMPRCIDVQAYLKKKRDHGNQFLLELKQRREEREQKKLMKNQKDAIEEGHPQEEGLTDEHSKPYHPDLGTMHLSRIEEALKNGQS